LLVQLPAYFKQEPLKAITTKRITEYRAWRAEQGVGPATLNAELGILRRIMKRARLWAVSLTIYARCESLRLSARL
jgi:hypothetical protein